MAFLESISIARTFGKVFGYRPDEFWESFAIGISNIIGSYFGSFPVTGSFSRTALNASTGVKTTFGGITLERSLWICLESRIRRLQDIWITFTHHMRGVTIHLSLTRYRSLESIITLDHGSSTLLEQM